MEAPVLRRLLLFLILIGILISIYATIEVVDPALQSSCSVNSLISCQKVDSSGYTYVGPIPDWSIGLGGFLVLFVLGVFYVTSEETRYLQGLTSFSALGLAFSAYFAYLEVFKIGAICPVCLSAYLANIGVLLVALSLLRMQATALEEEEVLPKKKSSSKKKSKKSHAEPAD